MTNRQADIIDRVNTIVNRVDGIDITLKQVIDSKLQFLNYKLGNETTKVFKKLTKDIINLKESIIYNNRYYHTVNTDKLMKELNITELEMYSAFYALQDNGFVNVAIKGKELFILFNFNSIKDFINIGQDRLLNKVNTFE